MHTCSTSQTFIADHKDQEILSLQLALLQAQNEAKVANSRYQYMVELFLGGEDLNLFSSHSLAAEIEGQRPKSPLAELQHATSEPIPPK